MEASRKENVIFWADFDKIQNNEFEYNIENRKALGASIKKARRSIEKKSCYICNLDKKICNSHSVPKFCLSNIAIDGEVYLSSKLINISDYQHNKGIKSTGTFHLICEKCDSSLFQTYENVENFKKDITQKMLCEIAIKNYVHCIDKRYFEIASYEELLTRTDSSIISYSFMKMKLELSQIDLKNYHEQFKIAKKWYDSCDNTAYRLICNIALPYTVPIAFQGNIALICDLEDKIINYVFDKNIIPKDIHICVFPLKNETQILLFCKSADKSYRNFTKQFCKLDEDKQLEVINYIIFLYTEDYYISKNVQSDLFVNTNLLKVSRTNSDYVSFDKNAKPINDALIRFSLKNRSKIPNLLCEKINT
ncbi:MAG: hypothetical protein RR444_03735 [Oscillospiraceae bacterium]